mgnify:CR=1 FL=1
MSGMLNSGYVDVVIACKWLELNTLGATFVGAGFPAKIFLRLLSRASPHLRGEVAR